MTVPRLRIAYIAHESLEDLPPNLGHAVFLRRLAAEMRRAGHFVELLTPTRDGVAASNDHTPPRPLGSRGMNAALAKVGARIHRHGWNFGLTDGLLLASSAHGLGRFDLVYDHLGALQPGGLLLAGRQRIPLVTHVHSDAIEERARYGSPVHPPLRQWIALEQRLRVRQASACVAVSEEVRRWTMELGADPHRVVTIPNAVGEEFFTARDKATSRRQFGLSPDDFIVAYLGSFHPWYDLELALRAMQQLPERVKLVLVGGGIEEPKLKRLAQGSDRVVFLGSVDHTRVPIFLAGCDAALLPVRDAGSFRCSPMKLFEYLASGLPVVATRAGQLIDLVDDAVGRLVSPGDLGSLVSALAGLADNPDALRDMALKARKRALEHTWESYVQKLDGVFARALGR